MKQRLRLTQNQPQIPRLPSYICRKIVEVTEMNKKLQEGDGEEVNPEVDPYDGIPVETIISQSNHGNTFGLEIFNNSYYNLNSKDSNKA